MAKVQPRVFISYARSDDEPFVERLHRDLEAAGITVWWDRDTMASRGRTFLQEIRDAIEAVDRVIAVIGPGAIASDYVRYEWEHASLFAKEILPILRRGDYDLIPEAILPKVGYGLAEDAPNRRHAEDFRDDERYEQALDRLIAILAKPVPDLGGLDGTPALPPHFLPRRDDLRRLKEAVLADVLRPTVITSAKQTVALQGMGGIGKSVLAAAFARAISTRRAIGNGIVWLNVGQDATRLTLLSNMKTVGAAFGDAVADYFDEESARKCLSNVLANKVCLIILDDVWSMEQVEPFRDVLTPRCRLLITTRDGSLVTALDAQEHPVDVLSDEQALELLAEWSGQVRERLAEGARQVAEKCGNLPFALALCGAMAREGTPWFDLLDALQEADLTFIEARLPNYVFPNVLRALRVSVDMLGREDPAAVGRYHDLAVFPSKAAVPEAAVVTLWCRDRGFSERNARKLLTTLGRKAMLTVQGDSPHRRISLHDLQYDYLRAVAGGGIVTLHGALIDAYRSKCPSGWASGPDDGYFFQFLPTHLADAGQLDELKALLSDYAWIEAKLKADPATLVMDYELLPKDPILTLVRDALRLSAHVLAVDQNQLAGQLLGHLLAFDIAELRPLLEQARCWQTVPWLRPLIASLAQPGDPLLRILETYPGYIGGSSISTHLEITVDGRLVRDGGRNKVWELATGKELPPTNIESYPWLTASVGREGLPAALSATGYSWVIVSDFASNKRLLISTSSRDENEDTIEVRNIEDSNIIHILRGRWGRITGVAITSDNRRAIFSSVDGMLRVWDLEAGRILHTIRAHAGGIYALAVTPDGSRAVTASDDRSIKVWKLDVLRSSLQGDAKQPCMAETTAVAITPDGSRAISASTDHIMRVWDISTTSRTYSSEVTLLNTIQSGYISAMAITPTGQQAVVACKSDKHYPLNLWDLEKGILLRTLQGHTNEITVVAFTPDGSRAISASSKCSYYDDEKYDRTIKVWDLHTGEIVSVMEIGTMVGYDGDMMIAADDEHMVFVKDSAFGLNIADLLDHNLSSDLKYHIKHFGGGYHVKLCAATPDGDLAISVGSDGAQLKIWKTWELKGGFRRFPRPGEALKPYRIISNGLSESWADCYIIQAMISHDGRRVAATWSDRSLRVYDLESEENELTRFYAPDVIAKCMMTPNGKRFIAGDAFGRVHFLQLEGV